MPEQDKTNPARYTEEIYGIERLLALVLQVDDPKVVEAFIILDRLGVVIEETEEGSLVLYL